MGVVLNRTGIAEVERSAAVRRFEKQVAKAVKAEVQRIAPAGGPARGYRESITVDQHAETKVGSTDPFAHLIEYGSVNNPPYAPLRRAVRNLGLKVKESPR